MSKKRIYPHTCSLDMLLNTLHQWQFIIRESILFDWRSETIQLITDHEITWTAQAHKHRASVHNNILTNCRKMAQGCQKELRRAAIQSQRVCKETPYRARRFTREMMAFWKHYEKVEKEHRRKAEKEAQEQRRIDDEFREVTYFSILCIVFPWGFIRFRRNVKLLFPQWYISEKLVKHVIIGLIGQELVLQCENHWIFKAVNKKMLGLLPW